VRITLTQEGKALQQQAKEIPLKAANCIDLPPEKARALYTLLYELLNQTNNR
jgi:hypothetical protein